MVSERQRKYLQAMDIQMWVRRERAAASPACTTVPEEIPSPPDERPIQQVHRTVQPPTSVPADCPDSAISLDWEPLQAAVIDCNRCGELVANRTQTVFGVGDRAAELLVVGEAPGADEDAKGEPFVGRAGQLLNNMLRAIGLSRERVYIANVLKCRPPGNRDPRPEESANCEPYLNRQIKLIRPRLILVVGRIAAQNLLQTEEPISRLRGRVHQHAGTGIPVVVTYHPAYLLRSPHEKRKAWQDLRLGLGVFRGAESGA